MNTHTATVRSIRNFFLLLFVLSVPWWVLGGFYNVRVFLGLQLSALSLGMPAATALILLYRESGKAGILGLLRKTYDFRQIRPYNWFLPILFMYPSFVFVEFWVLRLWGVPVPSPHFSWGLPLNYLVLFLFSYLEELGWTGYAIGALQKRWSALTSAIILGIAWAGVHVPILSIVGYSFDWIFWHSLYVIAGRVLFVWIYNNAGKSLSAMCLLHASFGVWWGLWPAEHWHRAPDFYDPRILAVHALLYVAIVAFLWGPKTLAQYRYARADSLR